LWYSLGFRSRLLLFLPLVYVGIVIVLRDSGTDVRIYEQVLRGLLHEGSSAWIRGWEPLFFLLAKLGLWVFGSEVGALRFIGGFYVLVLAFFLVRADNRELLIFHLHYLPLFAYSHGMNAVRAGLATAVFLLAWQSLRRGFKWSFFLLSLASFLFHYSSALVFVLSYGNETRFKVWRNFLPLLLVFAVVSGSVFAYLDYFEVKLVLYSSSEAPSPFSGLARTVLVALLWMCFVSGKVPLKAKIKSFTFLVLPTSTDPHLLVICCAQIGGSNALPCTPSASSGVRHARAVTTAPLLGWTGIGWFPGDFVHIPVRKRPSYLTGSSLMSKRKRS
jgi:hypothetical protein